MHAPVCTCVVHNVVEVYSVLVCLFLLPLTGFFLTSSVFVPKSIPPVPDRGVCEWDACTNAWVYEK